MEPNVQGIIHEAIESYIITLRANLAYIHPVSEKEKIESKINLAEDILYGKLIIDIK